MFLENTDMREKKDGYLSSEGLELMEMQKHVDSPAC